MVYFDWYSRRKLQHIINFSLALKKSRCARFKLVMLSVTEVLNWKHKREFKELWVNFKK